MDSIILSPKHCLPFINPGRLAKVRHGKKNFGWGIIINFKKEKVTNPDDEPVYRVDVMVQCDKESVKSTSSEIARPATGGTNFTNLQFYRIFGAFYYNPYIHL